MKLTIKNISKSQRDEIEAFAAAVVSSDAIKFRAWTSHEAIGQTVKSPHTGDAYVVTSYSNETGLFIIGADLEMSPTDLLEYFVTLDGAHCGVLV